MSATAVASARPAADRRLDDPVAVVGLGCVFPGAADAGAFWDNIVAGRRSISEAPPDRLDPTFFGDHGGAVGSLTTRRGGFVGDEALLFEPGRFGIMPVAVDGAEPDQMMALKTAAAAIDDAGGLTEVDHERVGVILGRGGYLTSALSRLDQRVRTSSQLVEVLRTLVPDLEEDRLRAVQEAFAGQLGALRPDSSIGLVPNLAASRIANRFDFGGPSYTLDAACASSLIAIDAAAAELQSGRCDVVLAGGVHHCHDVTLWSVFSQLGALSPSGEIRPYSADADGILVSEGTGLLVLERLSEAERHGHRVYATIAATGVASDGRQATLMSPSVEGQVLALDRAYRRSRIDPGTVALVEGHGTATVAGDRAELETLGRVFGPPDGTTHRAVLGSVKSNIGHAMPAAGAAGLIKTVLAVHHGVLPPTLAADRPHPALAGTRFRLLSEAEEWTSPVGRRAGVNAFGFGGIDAHVVVEQHGKASPAARSGARARAGAANRTNATDRCASTFGVPAILLQGRDAAELTAQLRAVTDAGDGEGRYRLPATTSTAGARLAIVAPTPKRLELAARVLAKGEAWRGRNDVWFEPAGLVTEGGRVAFVFPGLEPTFDADVDEVGRWLGAGDGSGLPGEATSGIEQQGRQIFETGRLLDQALGRLGIRPDDVAGHSLGEWTGVFAAELIAPDRVSDFLDGLEPGSLEVPGVVFAALGCGADTAVALVDGLDGVTVSHDNCPHQSVICGPEAAVREAIARMGARKIIAQELPFRTGFHTPHFAPYTDVVRYHWDRMPLQAPRVPLWSATTCRPYPADPDAVRRLAVDHLLEPVRFRDLVGAMHDDGVRVFVQMGVGSLVAFTDDTLKGRPQLSISAAAPANPGLAQLARVAAALWVEGVDVDLEEVFGPSTEATPAASTRRPDAAAGPTVRLSLGTPLVRLAPGMAQIVTGVSSLASPPEGDRDLDLDGMSSALRAELDALRAETMDASASIAAAAAAPRRVLGPAASSSCPPSSWQQSVSIDTSTLPYVRDHCFFRQPAGWPDLSDLFPVVPMTTMVEMLCAAAKRLAPGLVVSHVERIRAFRWLTAAPPTSVTLTATRADSPEVVVEVAIDGYARATVHFAHARPPAPEGSFSPLRNARPTPLTAERLYAEHWMFHGPAFQGMRSIGALGDDGIDGSIEALDASGALLDNAGQLYGWWLMATASSDFLALPQSIERIEFFGLEPSPGDVLDTNVRVTELTDRTIAANLELCRGEAVAVRITGWVDRRFDSDEPLWTMLREPEHHLVASPVAERCVAVEERWSDSASRELMARRYLDGRERATYEGLNPREQRVWLLGRIAAKDAVRQKLWSEGHVPLFPIEVPLADDGPGRVRVLDGPAAGTHVAVTVVPWAAAAGVELPAIGLTEGGGDVEDACRGLEKELARSAAPGATVRSAVIRSPFYGDARSLVPGTDAESEQYERKEYAVAWSQPE